MALIILSHGDEESNIFGTDDEPLSVQEIIYSLSNESVIDTPKVWVYSYAGLYKMMPLNTLQDKNFHRNFAILANFLTLISTHYYMYIFRNLSVIAYIIEIQKWTFAYI